MAALTVDENLPVPRTLDESWRRRGRWSAC